MIDLSRSAATDLRLVLPVGFGWAITVWMIGAPGCAASVAIAAAVAAATGVFVRRAVGARGAHSARALIDIAVLVAIATSVLGVAVAVDWPVRSPASLRELPAGRPAEATIVADRDAARGASSFSARLRAVRADPTSIAGIDVPVRVVPKQGEALRAIAAGTTLKTTAEIVADAPGSSASYVLFVRETPTVVAGPSALLAMTDRARRAFAEVVARLPDPGGGLLRGLAIGDRSGIDQATTAVMQVTALTHLTAVSGSNCAVLVALVMSAGQALGAPRMLRACVAVAVLGGFVLLVRPDPSILRAAIMAVVVLVVHLVGRPVRGAPLLAIATIGMLVVDPWFARSYAFALSVLATSGIIVVAPRLTEILARRLWEPVAGLLAVPIAAQAACWPVTVLLSPTIPSYAVLANLVAEPLAPVATVLGLGACVLAPVWAGGATMLSAIAWVPATGIAMMARGFAAMPFASVPWPDGGAGVAAAVVVAGGVMIAVFVRNRARALVAGIALGGLVLGVGAVLVPSLAVRSTLPADWEIAACDVGQGDALVIREGTATALIDTGDDEQLLLDCLDLLGVAHVDLFVATHFDRDHVGAVPAVADRIGTALVGPLSRPADQAVIDTLLDADVDVRRAMVGTAGALGRLDWRVLWPPASTEQGGNDASVTVRFEPGSGCAHCLSGIFLGDLGASAQRRLLTSLQADDVRASVDVVKVAHHGSADQHAPLYRALAARVGLVSVGADNTYGHPTATALDMLEAAGTRAVRTDLAGTIVLSGQPGAINIWSQRADTSPRQSTAATVSMRTSVGSPEPCMIGRVSGRPYTRSRSARSWTTMRRTIRRHSTIAARRCRTASATGYSARKGTNGGQEAGALGCEHRPGAVVGDPARSSRSRHRPGDVPRRAGDGGAEGPVGGGGSRARGP